MISVWLFRIDYIDVIDGKNDFSEDELKGIQIDIYIEYGKNEDDLTNISELFLDLIRIIKQ